jgi:hypothetical protein
VSSGDSVVVVMSGLGTGSNISTELVTAVDVMDDL